MSYLIANMEMITECADKLAHLGEKLFNETEMKYRAGNKVRIKSLDWYNENKDTNGLVGLFTPSMVKLCGMVVTLDSAYNGKYTAIEEEAKGYYLDDSMITGLVVEEYIKDAWICPDGYEFRDENGNVIQARKIVLEKKKPEWPKTYKESLDALDYPTVEEACRIPILLSHLERLLICRDAYWKLAGEEMGLGKPWEPDWREKRYIIYMNQDVNAIISGYREKGDAEHHIFEFPTIEMRDAFKENFKELIEECKELL